jgi:transposase
VTRDELKRLSKNELIRLVLDLARRVEALEKMVSRSRKDSSTSSKPPSSDIVKPPRGKSKGRGGGKRSIGGQSGHDKHERKPFDADEIDDVFEYVVDDCPDCGGALKGAPGKGRVLQQVELVQRPFRVSEHRAPGYWCPRCRVHMEAQLPPEVECGGLFGPRMSAFVAYLKGGCHSSYTNVQSLLGDVLGVRVSTGFLAKVVCRTSEALALPYDELRCALPQQPWLNVDETGHKDCGKKLWTWCFRASEYTWFRIDPSRGSNVLREVLGESFGGVLGADYFSAYHKYMGDGDVRVQFCFAHLIRDVRFLTTLADKVTKNYGQRVLKAIKALFKVIHRREVMSPARFQLALEKAKKNVILKARSAPARTEAQNMATRFKKNAAAYFEFITTPGVEPTNNLAEQAIRFVVIDRKVTQGTRGKRGRAWCERIWTTMATCAQQNRSAFEFLRQAVHARFNGMPPPSLLRA